MVCVTGSKNGEVKVRAKWFWVLFLSNLCITGFCFEVWSAYRIVYPGSLGIHVVLVGWGKQTRSKILEAPKCALKKTAMSKNVVALSRYVARSPRLPSLVRQTVSQPCCPPCPPNALYTSDFRQQVGRNHASSDVKKAWHGEKGGGTVHFSRRTSLTYMLSTNMTRCLLLSLNVPWLISVRMCHKSSAVASSSPEMLECDSTARYRMSVRSVSTEPHRSQRL